MVSAPSLTYAGCLPGSMLDREPDTSSPRDVKYQQTRSASSTGYTDCADKDTAHPCRLGRALHTPYSYCTLRRLPAAPQQCAPAMLARQLIASCCLKPLYRAVPISAHSIESLLAQARRASRSQLVRTKPIHRPLQHTPRRHTGGWLGAAAALATRRARASADGNAPRAKNVAAVQRLDPKGVRSPNKSSKRIMGHLKGAHHAGCRGSSAGRQPRCQPGLPLSVAARPMPGQAPNTQPPAARRPRLRSLHLWQAPKASPDPRCETMQGRLPRAVAAWLRGARASRACA